MDSDTPLDYALFQLSPRRTRCELFVSGDGKTEKLASGFLKPFATHLKVAEEQAAQAVQSIKLEVEKRKNGGTWFNKGTLERFVRFVSTPEVLELVNTFDAEMAQLEGARRIYSQGAGNSMSNASAEHETATVAAADITKKELLKAIDVRLVAVKQDLTMACARASSAGFTIDNVSELLLFAEQFGAHRLNEACTKFISLCQRRPELISQQHSSPCPPRQWKGFDDGNVRSSSGSDMSIDEPEVEPRGPAKPLTIGGGGLQIHKASNSQPSQQSTDEPPASSQQPKPISRRFVEREVEKSTAESIPTSVTEPAQQSVGGLRRLSVQDRINLFESKRKEQAAGPNAINSGTAGGGGGNKVVIGKGEHRRTPSDISVEKSVLRRWSGASDMSIDVNSSYSDRKDSVSAAGTPTSANLEAQSGTKSEEKEANGLDTVTSWSWMGSKDSPVGISSASSSSSLSSSQLQAKAFAYDKDHVGEVTTTSSTQPGLDLKKEQGDHQTSGSVKRVETHGFSDQAASQVQQKPFLGSSEGAGLKEQAGCRAQSKSYSEEHVRAKDQAALQIPFRDLSAVAKQFRRKDPEGLQSQPKDVLSEADDVGVKGQSSTVTQFRTFVRKTENMEVKSRGSLDSQSHFKASSGKEEIVPPEGELQMQSQWRFTGKPDGAGVKEAAISGQASFPVKPKQQDAGLQGTNLHRRLSGPYQISKLQGSRDEMTANEGKAPILPGRKAMESMEISHPSSASLTEQIQVVRPSKGNQELNNELQMKANELEKLFAAHKLRVNNDQMASSRRSKPVDMPVDHAPKTVEGRSAVLLPSQLPARNIVRDASNGVEFDANLLLKMVDTQEYSSNTKQKLGTLSPSDDVRGKFYEKYMQKRDAKLRAEWGSERAQREAKMKAMHDSLDHSQAEMKAKFAGCAAGQDLTNARRRAEKLMAFSVHLAMRNKDQQAEDSHQGEQEVIEELYEQIYNGEDKSDSDNHFGDGSSKSINSKKFLSNRSFSSSTPRTSLAALPKPSGKATYSGFTKRRTQPENPLAQSVPNFSDFRKENTKPSTGISKVNTRAQQKNFSRSKSITEETNLANEDKPRRSQSMRKSSATSGELKDLSPLNSDSVIPTPYGFSKEQSEPTVLDIVQKSGELKQILRKGNGVGPGAGVGVARLKASVVSEALKNAEDFEAIEDRQEDPLERFKEDEEFERTSIEGNLGTTDFALNSDGEKPRPHEFENSDDPGSEDDVLRSLSQAHDDPSVVLSKFDSFAGNLQDSPGASPGSWNSHIQHSFAYAHEASDIDASLDSPTDSPALWNSHPLNQMMGADAARMRKKWGSAQIPMLVANASQQPRKDVTKGFKRLLKFGRKSRGVESLATDCVSASTASEGDDDTEDSRDLVQHSSDDLRKSRMGYSLPSYDGFNEGDIFSEQAQSLRSSIPNPPANFKLREDHLSGSSIKAPRSFFSLSTFRSKGMESKLR